MGDGGSLVVLLTSLGVNMLTWELLLVFHCALLETGTIAEKADGDYNGSSAAPI